MIHLPEIWNCIVLPKKQWTTIDDIYRLVEHNLALDDEDYEWRSGSGCLDR